MHKQYIFGSMGNRTIYFQVRSQLKRLLSRTCTQKSIHGPTAFLKLAVSIALPSTKNRTIFVQPMTLRFPGLGASMIQKTSTVRLQLLLSFATSSMDVMFERTPHQLRFQMCHFTTKGGLSFKVGSVSCDPDCPYCTCVVYPNNSVRNWSCDLEDGVSLKGS